jgi:hypothetical protein
MSHNSKKETTNKILPRIIGNVEVIANCKVAITCGGGSVQVRSRSAVNRV